MKKQIESQYVDIVIAKLLHDRGIDINSEANWWIRAADRDDKTKQFFAKDHYELENLTQIDEDTYHNVYHVLSVPEIWQVVEWMRVESSIWIQVEFGKDEDFVWFNWYIHSLEKNYNYDCLVNDSEKSGANTPQEAYQAAIKYALNNLI